MRRVRNERQEGHEKLNFGGNKTNSMRSKARARGAGDARDARDAWVAAVVSKTRTDNKAARKNAAPGALDRTGPPLATLSDARRAASAIAGLAAVEATVARASLVFAMSAGENYGTGTDIETLQRRMSLATSAASEALRFSAAVEEAAMAATASTAKLAAEAAQAASRKSAEIAEARNKLSETSDGELVKRLVIDIARLERERADDVAAFRVSASAPVFTLVDDFGLEAAETKVRLAYVRRGDERGETSDQAGGASEEPAVIPPFHYHTGGDQLQWPFSAAS